MQPRSVLRIRMGPRERNPQGALEVGVLLRFGANEAVVVPMGIRRGRHGTNEWAVAPVFTAALGEGLVVGLVMVVVLVVNELAVRYAYGVRDDQEVELGDQERDDGHQRDGDRARAVDASHLCPRLRGSLSLHSSRFGADTPHRVRN